MATSADDSASSEAPAARLSGILSGAGSPANGETSSSAGRQALPVWPLSPIPSPGSVSPDVSGLGFDDDSDKENRPPNVQRISMVVSVRIWRGNGVQRVIGKINGRLATSCSLPFGLTPAEIQQHILRLERELRSWAVEDPSPWL